MTYKESQLTGRLRLRHLKEVTEARGEEMAAQRERFQRLAREDSAPRAVSSFNLFQTPEEIADRMAALLPWGRTLEPSAGLGRLYRAVRYRSDCPITLVEISPTCCAELYRETSGDGNAKLVQGDFLEMTPTTLGTYSSIVMNPPFKMGCDIKHIKHAATFLAPGGRLVALCANGPRQQATLRPWAESWEELPPKSFRAEGTGVSVALLTYRVENV